MKRRSLVFTSPEQVTIQEETLDFPAPGQVLVNTLVSAISPGTEMLAYRGNVPEDMALDESIASLGGASFKFPFKYGYACVGEVAQVGKDVDPGWQGRLVFSFHPHESAFLASPSEMLELPNGTSIDDAVFLPNTETAVNFVMDARPLVGEAVAVFGLGIVGLLTTALLARFPLSALVTFDRYELRRAQARLLGAMGSLDPADSGAVERARTLFRTGGSAHGADLAFEVSGSPAALDQAIALTGYAGRVVIGSWYGRKKVELDLGGRFHRSRIRLIDSQVSTLAPELSGRWDKARRMGVAWNHLRKVGPSRWITQRFPFEQAAEAYRLLAGHPEETIQVVLDY